MIAFETRQGSTLIKTIVYLLPGDTNASFGDRVERARNEAKHRAEQLEPVRRKVVVEHEPGLYAR